MQLEAVDKIVNRPESECLLALLILYQSGQNVVPVSDKASVLLDDLHGIRFIEGPPLVETNWQILWRRWLSPLLDLGDDGFQELIRLCSRRWDFPLA